MTYKNWMKVAAGALLAAGLVLPACASSKPNGTPSNDGGTKKKDAGTTKDAGTKDAGTKDASTTDASAKDASAKDASTDGGGGACAKDSTKDCYTCDTPTSDDEFLNHCTSATCTAYDNSKLTKIVNGKLPDLP